MLSNRKLLAILALFLSVLVPAGILIMASADTPHDTLTPTWNTSISTDGETYIPTSRDTKQNPETAEFEAQDLSAYTLLFETASVRYWWREDRDIFAVEHKQTGYIMKTGVDLPFPDDAKDRVKELKKDPNLTVEDILAQYEPFAADLNTTYTGIANSLITIEYTESDKTKYISSASRENAVSELSRLSDAEYMLTVCFSSPEITLNVYVTFGEDSISYRIPSAEFGGADLVKLTSIDITPFLGASGGKLNVLDESGDWQKVERYRIPGYVLVPDGSGALIRFVDNTSTFNSYVGDIYGKDYAAETYYNFTSYDDVPVNDPCIPVFGIAQGNQQMGFVAWADSGAEYMDVIVNPDETYSTTYTWAYPRFEYDIQYYQLYDEHGNGFFTQMDSIYSYDIDMTYQFLFGDGTGSTNSADYVGMALTYRQHLIENGTLTPIEAKRDDIPIRLDFIMCDSESGVIGTHQVNVTTVDDVREILNDVMAGGIQNINSGLIGWQRKGESLMRPDKASYSLSVGTKGSFAELIQEFAEEGVEISQSRNMVKINTEMTGYYNTAVKSVSNWYVCLDEESLLPESIPTYTFGLATPKKVSEWTVKLANSVEPYSEAITLTGISSILTSNWNRNGVVTSLTDAIALYKDTLAQYSGTLKFNLEKPNMYLWEYTDKYLQIPVGNSWYIYESDSVPFLQMVLNGTMEMYAPYANFSFYTQDAILRMIDYNVSPSFILSREASWNLADSFSANLYSTEYSLYADLIRDIYAKVNSILSQVQGYDWTGRAVPENGVVINTYEKDGRTLHVIVNYTQSAVSYLGTTVPGETAMVAQGGAE